jgi:hypothetical protein
VRAGAAGVAQPVTATDMLIEGNLIGELPQFRRYTRVLNGNPG